MAADATVPNNFTAGTPAVADQVDANFTAVLNWLNTNAAHLDATKAFTAVPSGPAGVDPTTADQLTRKGYVDKTPDTRCGAWVSRNSSDQTFPVSATTAVSFDTEVADSDGFWSTGSTVTIPTGKGGVYSVTAVLFSIGGLAPSNANFGAYLSLSGHANVPFGFTSSVTLESSASWTGPLNAGQTITVQVKNGSGTTAITGRCYLYVYRISA